MVMLGWLRISHQFLTNAPFFHPDTDMASPICTGASLPSPSPPHSQCVTSPHPSLYFLLFFRSCKYCNFPPIEISEIPIMLKWWVRIFYSDARHWAMANNLHWNVCLNLSLPLHISRCLKQRGCWGWEDAGGRWTRAKKQNKKKTLSPRYGEIWMFNMRDKVVPSPPLLLLSRRSFLNKTSNFFL